MRGHLGVYCLFGLAPPLVVAALGHVCAVSFAEAPGTWPVWADGVGRALVSMCSAVPLLWLVVQLGRGRRSTRDLLLVMGMPFLLATTSWPWVGGGALVLALSWIVASITGAALIIRARSRAVSFDSRQ